MSYGSAPYSVTFTSPGPVKESTHIVAKLNTSSVDNMGIVFQAADVEQHYCVFFEYAASTQYMKLLRIAPAGNLTLDTHILPSNTNAFVLDIIYTPGQINIHKTVSGVRTEDILTSTDSSLTSGSAGILHGADSASAGTGDMYLWEFLIINNDLPAVPVTTSLTGTATIDPTGTIAAPSNVKLGAAVLTGTSTIDPAGFVALSHEATTLLVGTSTVTGAPNAISSDLDVTAYRFAEDGSTDVEPQVWRELINTPTTLSATARLRLRWLLKNNTADNSSAFKLNLETREVYPNQTTSAWVNSHDASSWINQQHLNYNPASDLPVTTKLVVTGNASVWGCPAFLYEPDTSTLFFIATATSGSGGFSIYKLDAELLQGEPSVSSNCTLVTTAPAGLVFSTVSNKFIKCNNGDLIHFAFSDTANTAYYLRSIDNGVTWGAETVVNNALTFGTPGLYPAMDAFVATDGTIWLQMHSWVISSSDHGVSWGSWVDLDFSVETADYQHGTFPFGSDGSVSVVGAIHGDTLQANGYYAGSWYGLSSKLGYVPNMTYKYGARNGSVASAVGSTGLVFSLALSTFSDSINLVASAYDPSANAFYGNGYFDSMTFFDSDESTNVPRYAPFVIGAGSFKTVPAISILRWDDSANTMYVVYSNIDPLMRHGDVVHTKLMFVKVTFTDMPTAPSVTLEEYRRAMFIEGEFFINDAVNVRDEYFVFTLLPHLELTSNVNYESQIITLSFSDVFVPTGKPTTQQLGGGTFLADNEGFFGGGVYPSYAGLFGTRSLGVGEELEVETSIIAKADDFIPNVLYQVRLATPTMEPLLWNYVSSDGDDYLDSTGIPLDWNVSPAGNGSGEWVRTSAPLVWKLANMETPQLSGLTDYSWLDITPPNANPYIISFLANIYSSSDTIVNVEADGVTIFDTLDTTDDYGISGVYTTGYNAAIPPGTGAVRFIGKVKVGAVTYNVENNIDRFWFFPGQINMRAENTLGYSVNNNVIATITSAATSSLLVGTATMSPTATIRAVITAAASLVGAASTTPNGTLVGVVPGHTSLVGTATITPVALVGNTKPAATSLLATASIDLEDYAGTVGLFEQHNYRWRNDDGDEATATWMKAVNTPAILPYDILHRLRVSMRNTSTTSSFTSWGIGLEAKINDGAWDEAATISGATACCTPEYEVELSFDLTLEPNNETHAQTPVLLEDSYGRWHLFYSSRTSDGVWRVRYRRSLNKGVTWDVYQSEITAPLQDDAIAILNVKLLEKAGGDLFFFADFSGSVHVVTHSTNGGNSWGAFIQPLRRFYGTIYWDVEFYNGEEFWYTFHVFNDSWHEWTLTGTIISSDGITWDDVLSATARFAYVGFDLNYPDRYGTLGYYDTTYNGVKLYVNKHFTDASSSTIENYAWDGVAATPEDFPYVSDELTYNTANSPFNFIGHVMHFAKTENAIIGYTVPKIFAFHFNAGYAGNPMIPFSNESGSLIEGASYFAEHYSSPGADIQFNSGHQYAQTPRTKSSGVMLFTHEMIATYQSFSFINYKGQTRHWYPDNLEGDSTAPKISYPIQHKSNDKIYACSVIFNTATIRIAVLNTQEGTAIGLWDDGSDTTQQIDTGTFISENYGVTMMGTAGHVQRELAPQETFEMEFYIKLLNNGTLTQGDTVCFRVNEADSIVNLPCVFISFEESNLLATATLTATGSVDGPTTSLLGEATLTATATYVHNARASLLGESSVIALSLMDRPASVSVVATADMSGLGTCSKDGAVVLTGSAELTTHSLSVVKAQALLVGEAHTIFAEPSILVSCKTSLLSTSALTAHGHRTVTGKTSLQSMAYLFGWAAVKELPVCLTIYRQPTELVIIKRQPTVLSIQNKTLTIIRASEELVITKEPEETTYVSS